MEYEARMVKEQEEREAAEETPTERHECIKGSEILGNAVRDNPVRVAHTQTGSATY